MNLYEELIISIKQLHELSSEATRPAEEEGLTEPNVYLLFLLHRSEKIKTADISAFFSITPGAATAIADKLETRGLIRRERSSEDRRAIFISLTDKGRAYVEAKKREHASLFEKILSGYTPGELETAIGTIRKLSRALAEYRKT